MRLFLMRSEKYVRFGHSWRFSDRGDSASERKISIFGTQNAVKQCWKSRFFWLKMKNSVKLGE